MAVNFLDEILVELNGTSSSKKYLQLNGGGGSGSVSGQAGVGFRPLNAGSNVHASIEALENGNASYQTNLTFNTNGSNSDSAPSERMRITSAGNVGIGTTSPSQKLDVVGNIKTSGRVYINGTGNFIDTTRNASSQANYIRFYDSSTSSVEAYVGYTSNNRDFKINSANGNGTLTLQAGGGTAIYVDSSQKVGIGTTAPSQKLTVAGTIMSTASSNPTLILQDSTHSDITIKGDSGIFSVSNASVGQNITMLYNGNVGIGTTSPSEKLEVAGKVYIESQGVNWNETTPGLVRGALHFDPVGSGSDNTGNAITFGASDTSTGTNAQAGIYTRSDGSYGTKMYFATTDSYAAGSKTRMMIDENGNVGIGTTGPSKKLDVNGDVTFGTGNKFQTIINALEGVGANGVYLRSAISSAANPSFSNSDDTNTGMFLPGSDVLGLSTAGSERLRITSAGNVGIGTTSPTRKLDVAGDIYTSERLYVGSNQYYVKLCVWNSATYGIGMTNGFTYGALNNDYAMTFCMNDDSDRGFWWGYSGQNKSTGAMSLNSEGKLKVNHSIGLGTANPSATQGRIDASNDIVAFSTSDIRLKDNIKSIDKALDKVNSIQGIEFDWIEKEEVHGNSGHDIGVIAQEIEKILPDVVTTRDNGYKAVKYEKIVPLLIEAIKDLSKQVDGLKRLI